MAKTRSESEDGQRGIMSFGDHLEELRFRLILCLVVPLPLALVLFAFATGIRNFLTEPALRAMSANGLPARMQALGPAEVLTTDLKLSLIGAIVLSAPWIIWQAWKFVEPGLYANERRFVHFLIPGSIGLTLSGLGFLYYVMLPLMLQVLISFGVPGPESAFGIPDAQQRVERMESSGLPSFPIRSEPPEDPAPGEVWIDPVTSELVMVVPVRDDETKYELLSTSLNRAGTIAQEFRLGEYIGFVLTLALAVSIAFQMPLVILLLGWVGLADRRFLQKNRRYALLVCALLGAILTPADVLSMILLLVPLYLLYEVGILLLRFAPADRVARGALFSGGSARTEGGASDDSRPSENRVDPGDPDSPSQSDSQVDPDLDNRPDSDGSDPRNEPERTDEDDGPGGP